MVYNYFHIRTRWRKKLPLTVDPSRMAWALGMVTLIHWRRKRLGNRDGNTKTRGHPTILDVKFLSMMLSNSAAFFAHLEYAVTILAFGAQNKKRREEGVIIKLSVRPFFCHSVSFSDFIYFWAACCRSLD